VAQLLVAGACRRTAEQRPPPAASDDAAALAASPSRTAPRPPPSDAPNRLPEDPVKAKAATEQWNQHLVEEERERQEALERAHEPDRKMPPPQHSAARPER
jgi:hypothetical protein